MSIAKMSKISIIGLKEDLLDVISRLSNLGTLQIVSNEKLSAEFTELNSKNSDLKQHLRAQLGYYSELEEDIKAKYIPGLAELEEVNQDLDINKLDDDQASDEVEKVKPIYEYFYGRMQEFARADKLASSERLEGQDNYQPSAKYFNPEAEIDELVGILQKHLELLDYVIEDSKERAGVKGSLFATKRDLDAEAYFQLTDKQVEVINNAKNYLVNVRRVNERQEKIRDVKEDLQDQKDRVKYIDDEFAEDLPKLLQLHLKLLYEAVPEVESEDAFDSESFNVELSDQEPVDEKLEKLITSIEKLNQYLEDNVSEDSEPTGARDTQLVDNEAMRITRSIRESIASRDRAQNEQEDEKAEEIRLTKGLKGLLQERRVCLSKIEKQDKNVKELEAEISKIETELKENSGNYGDYEVLHDFYQIQLKKLEALRKVNCSDSLFVLEAYVATALAENTKADLEKRFDLNAAVEDLEVNDDYPILLQNHKLVRSFQTLISMYALPKAGVDVDPTTWSAVFYIILFGMMLGDVGYGLLLVIACAIGIFVFKAEGNSKRTMGMLGISGIVSIPFGFMFGGFFGNLLTSVTDGAVTMKPLLFDPMQEPIAMLVFSMGVGIIHLFAGMAIDIYVKIKRGDWKTAFFKIAPWYLIISGLILWPVHVKAGRRLALAGFIVILLLGDQSTKNPLKRIISGISSVTDIPSWLSDILSYSRILALALSTSVIAMVVNILSMLIGYKGIGVIFFVIIMIFGHILNLALSGLSAYVHTTRLQYVEFFGKFYEGGGKAFEPLNYESKHTRISQIEDEQDKVKNGEFKKIKAEYIPINK